MVEIIRKAEFSKNIKHLKDQKLKERLKKQILKILEDPETAGRYLHHDRKFEKKIYIPPFRLIFAYDNNKDILYLIDFDKRGKIYRK
jgi:mRNA-degrading endonuclease RelE of RelBE toxin-antitoxin system